MKDRRRLGSSLHGTGRTSEGAVGGYIQGQLPTWAHPSQTWSPAVGLHPSQALRRIQNRGRVGVLLNG